MPLNVEFQTQFGYLARYLEVIKANTPIHTCTSSDSSISARVGYDINSERNGAI